MPKSGLGLEMLQSSKIPDGIRIVNHDWRCSSRTSFKVCGEVLITNTQVFFFLGFLFLQYFPCITDTLYLKWKTAPTGCQSNIQVCTAQILSEGTEGFISLFFLVSVTLWWILVQKRGISPLLVLQSVGCFQGSLVLRICVTIPRWKHPSESTQWAKRSLRVFFWGF